MSKSASLPWEIKRKVTQLQFSQNHSKPQRLASFFFFSLMCLTFYGINNANKEEIIFAEH